MKNISYLIGLVFLCGCVSSGSDGVNGQNGINGKDGQDGKSVYRIWLDNGNTGTEQDFLDSLKIIPDNNSEENQQPENTETDNNQTGNQDTEPEVVVPVPERVYPENIGADKDYRNYVLSVQNWPDFGSVNKYSIDVGYDVNYAYADATGNNTTQKYKRDIYEKEMNLVNYGVKRTYDNYTMDEFGNEKQSFESISAFIHNREGIGVNVYVPENDAVFNGGTMAYVYKTDSGNITDYKLLYGNAEYSHNNSHPTLTLDFKDYYTFVMNGSGFVSISGENNIDDAYDLIIGENINTVGYRDSKIKSIGFVKKDDIEEVVGTYRINPSGYNNGYYNADINIDGAFGGTK